MISAVQTPVKMKRRSAGNDYVKSVIFFNILNLCNLSKWSKDNINTTFVFQSLNKDMFNVYSVCVCVSQGGATGQVSVIG